MQQSTNNYILSYLTGKVEFLQVLFLNFHLHCLFQLQSLMYGWKLTHIAAENSTQSVHMV